MLGFVKTEVKEKDNNQIDFRKEKQKRERIFTIVFGLLSFTLLNLILYLMTRV